MDLQEGEEGEGGGDAKVGGMGIERFEGRGGKEGVRKVGMWGNGKAGSYGVEM